jgi:hypothetical protein
MRGVTLARTFRVLDSLVLAALVYMGALCFKKVTAVEHNQLAYCIQVVYTLHMLCSPHSGHAACAAFELTPGGARSQCMAVPCETEGSCHNWVFLGLSGWGTAV